MDKVLFVQACEKIIHKDKIRNGIGTLSEKTLHAVLKNYFEPDESYHEVKVNSFVADIVRGNEIIEIQTRSFDKLRNKLENFLPNYHVTVVYPIAATKWMYWIDPETGEISSKRKSPKKGTPYEAFRELYKIKSYLLHPNLSICIIMIDMEEYRYLNGWSSDRKKGSSRCDRIPIDVVEEVCLDRPEDYEKLLPEVLQVDFTSKDYKKQSKLSLCHAQTALNVLYYAGVVKRTGKTSNLYLYERIGTE
ncbi:MAG: hypothetical protein ACLRZ7_06295 [Lachnospiraceae bacterium]